MPHMDDSYAFVDDRKRIMIKYVMSNSIKLGLFDVEEPLALVTKLVNKRTDIFWLDKQPIMNFDM